jgi:hypothetical protein
MMNLDDAIYALRNVATGDDEQTRIADAIDDVDPALRAQVQALIDAGDYDNAYVVAVRPILEAVTRDELRAAIDAWVVEFAGGDEFDSEDERAGEMQALAADCLALYDVLVSSGWKLSSDWKLR